MKKALLFAFMLLTLPAATFSQDTSGGRFIAKADPDGVQRVEITGGSYFFKPDHVIVKMGVPVELKLRKEPSIVPHDFVLKAPETGIDISESLAEEPKTFSFTPTKVDKYAFYCDKKFIFFRSHRDRGMEGVFEVTE